MTPYSHVEVHVHEPEQRADLTLRHLPQPTLFRAKQKFVAFAVAGNGSALGSRAAQPHCLLSISLFDLQLWSPSKKASKCR